MIIKQCDICGEAIGVTSFHLPVYRTHDGSDGLTHYEHPKIYFRNIDICEACLMRCTNIHDDTVMGYGNIFIQKNPELK